MTKLVREIDFAGTGLSEVASLLANIGDGPPVSWAITLRSNPEGTSTMLADDLTRPTLIPKDLFLKDGRARLEKPRGFARGQHVLLSDDRGAVERAQIVAIDRRWYQFRSLDSADGSIGHDFLLENGARVSRLREVRYWLEAQPERYVLMRQFLGAPASSISAHIHSLEFTYEDAWERPLAPEDLNHTRAALVRVSIGYALGTQVNDRRSLSTVAYLDRHQGIIDFSLPTGGRRLVRYFHPIESPIGVASRQNSEWGLLMSGGVVASQDASYFYFHLDAPDVERVPGLDDSMDWEERRSMPYALTEKVIWLYDVRGPVDFAFSPQGSPTQHSVYAITSSLSWGQMYRIFPDKYGGISDASAVQRVYHGRALADATSLAVTRGGDIYAASKTHKAIYRLHESRVPDEANADEIVKLPYVPTTLTLGPRGGLWFTYEAKWYECQLMRLWLDRNGAHRAERARSLPGACVSLSSDPVSENLYALVREPAQDYVVYELDPGWFARIFAYPKEVFRLSEFRDNVHLGVENPKRGDIDLVSPVVMAERLPAALVPDDLDFIDHDPDGFLYVGAREMDLVMKFDLPRQEGWHQVGVTAVSSPVPENWAASPKVSLQTWAIKEN